MPNLALRVVVGVVVLAVLTAVWAGVVVELPEFSEFVRPGDHQHDRGADAGGLAGLSAGQRRRPVVH